jgi:hypothetical protein
MNLQRVEITEYMDDGASLQAPATVSDVRQWAAGRGYAIVPIEPTRQMINAAEGAYMPFGDMALALQVAIAEAQSEQYSTYAPASTKCDKVTQE